MSSHATRPRDAGGPFAGPIPILFTHFGAEWIRGSERCLLDLLTYLDRRRFAPLVWCNAETLAKQVRGIDLPVVTSRFSILGDWAPPRWDVRRFFGLVREASALVAGRGIRLIHSNGAAPTQWLLPVARRARIGLLTHLHTPYVRRDRFLLGIHQATLAVGVTRGCLEGLLEDGMPAGRTRTIYNGVDVSRWDGQDQYGLRTRLGIGPDHVVITQVGSLIHRKGIDLLLRAFASLWRERPACRLLIVGEGPDRADLEALRDRLGLTGLVHFLGLIDPAGPVFRDATDIAVSPARSEGFGLTVIEAGAAELPVVATRTPGMDEIITDGRNGLIVPVEDPGALSEALHTLVDQPALRQRLGESLRHEVESRFLTSGFVANFESTYEELLAVPPRELGWRGPHTPGRCYGRWLRDSVGQAIRHRDATQPMRQDASS